MGKSHKLIGNYIIVQDGDIALVMVTGFQGVANIVQNTGGSQPHNNIPPYLAVFIWKRTS